MSPPEALAGPVTEHLQHWRRTLPQCEAGGALVKYPWELVQIGNCGSPIETEAGWLVLSHGVGPMRQYCIGAFLLDLEQPERVLGRLREPIMIPEPSEREGYVPNVVYSCGALLHQGQLIIPYGLADHATGFATVALGDVLAAMS